MGYILWHFCILVLFSWAVFSMCSYFPGIGTRSIKFQHNAVCESKQKAEHAEPWTAVSTVQGKGRKTSRPLPSGNHRQWIVNTKYRWLSQNVKSSECLRGSKMRWKRHTSFCWVQLAEYFKLSEERERKARWGAGEVCQKAYEVDLEDWPRWEKGHFG